VTLIYSVLFSQSLPSSFDTDRLILYSPTVGNVTVGFCASENFVPLPKYQSQLVGTFVDVSVNKTARGCDPFVTFAVKFDTGITP
jgi:hypothetical protein